ncbi:cold-regulated protein 27 [Diospyros lotus]|uniref:cold-regulated protein 27 n=1 Tax=Diospyros lotus TaxID=55363 RepID=UPI002251D444|nr:cold-regulated protein 27 [Diospyros lotus]
MATISPSSASPDAAVEPATSLSSEVSGDSASSESRQSLSQESLARESMCTEWTDEKHSLYLNSMEASFVNELYNSFDLLGWRSQNHHCSDTKSLGKKHASVRVSSGQYKVLRSGCWGKINFDRHESRLEKADGSGGLLTNPWIRHFRSSFRHKNAASSFVEQAPYGTPAVHVKGKTELTSALDTSLEQSSACHSHLPLYDSVGSSTEVTDQNFVDQDIEGEKGSHRLNAKRMKSSAARTPSNDQVVPKLAATADTSDDFFPSRKGSPTAAGKAFHDGDIRGR